MIAANSIMELEYRVPVIFVGPLETFFGLS